MTTDLTTTKARLEAARETRRRREEGETWAVVTEALGFSESTGRKLLGELEDYEAKPGAATHDINTVMQEAIRDDMAAAKAEADAQPKPRSGRYVKLTCGCGSVIRTSGGVAASETVHCSKCDQPFTP